MLRALQRKKELRGQLDDSQFVNCLRESVIPEVRIDGGLDIFKRNSKGTRIPKNSIGLCMDSLLTHMHAAIAYTDTITVERQNCLGFGFASSRQNRFYKTNQRARLGHRRARVTVASSVRLSVAVIFSVFELSIDF